MSHLILGEVRTWLAADTIASTGTSAANHPAADLKSPDLGKTYRDTSSSSAQGITWNYNGESVSAFAVELVGMNGNSPASGNRLFDLQLSTSSPWNGLGIVATAAGFRLDENDRYAVGGIPMAGTTSRDRLAALVCFGVDTLDSGGPSPVNGRPKTQAHASGKLAWIHTAAMEDGYHEAAFLAIGIKPLLLPSPTVSYQGVVELRRGYGHRVECVWQDPPLRIGDGGIDDDADEVGLRELANFVAAQANRPVMAILDTTGLNASGVAVSAESAPFLRLGTSRIVEFSAPSYQARASKAPRTMQTRITLETWEERPEKVPQ